MFSGIVEVIGTIRNITSEGRNKTFYVESTISKELYIDQSISHNGVCLTVIEEPQNNQHAVTAVEETLIKSNLGSLNVGDIINLERCITMESRLDGHMVQGHVDATIICKSVEERDGSWNFTFTYEDKYDHLLVDKGSICINGVSLTLITPIDKQFMVTIIPYTYEHTTFRTLKEGDTANVEFDIIGKYVHRYLSKMKLG
jgi:riboflavin synthase